MTASSKLIPINESDALIRWGVIGCDVRDQLGSIALTLARWGTGPFIDERRAST